MGSILNGFRNIAGGVMNLMIKVFRLVIAVGVAVALTGCNGTLRLIPMLF